MPVDFKALAQNPPPFVPPLLPTEGVAPLSAKLITDGNSVFASDQIVIKFKSNVAETAIQSLLRTNNLTQRSHIRAIGWRLLTVPVPLNATWWVRVLQDSPLVENVELNGALTASSTPLDAQYAPYQWNLRKIGMEAAWDRTRGGTYVTAVLDSGIDRSNTQDLLPKILRDSNGNLMGADFSDPNNPNGYPDDDVSHGTFVSAIIGAQTAFSPYDFFYPNTQQSSGIAGVNPYGLILPVKVLRANSQGIVTDPTMYNYSQSSNFALASGITYAASVPKVRVMNASLQRYPAYALYSSGSGSNSPIQPGTVQNPYYAGAVSDALRTANNNGVLFVASIGNFEGENNDSRDKISYPGAYWRAMAVGATAPTGPTYNAGANGVGEQLASYSRRGYHLSVMAPGSSIYSTSLGSSYGTGNGTSFSAPQVAGLAGLVLQEFPSMTWWDIRYHIEDTCDYLNNKTGFDSDWGWGRINADKATQVVYSTQGWPATTNLPAQKLLVSIPAWFISSYPDDTAANRAQDVEMMFPGANAQVAWYDPMVPGYRPYSDPAVPRMGPGRGYFVTLANPVNTGYNATLPFQKANHRMPVHLKSGWNTIGVPGHNPITWNPQTFRVATENKPAASNPDRTHEGMKIELSFQDAISAGWIDPQPLGFNYNVASGPGQYYLINTGDPMQPGLGYFIHANLDCELLIPNQ